MYGNNVLDDISFSLEPDQHLAIIGEAGSGKTSLAKALSGKLFYKGSVETNNRQKVVMVEQHYHFKTLSNTKGFYYQQRYNSTESNDCATVLDELNQISTDREYINELLSNLQLTQRRNDPLLHLSSGEHKRFQLIKALSSKPGILILDNPFTGLDVISRENLGNILNGIAQNQTQLIIITQADEILPCITHVLSLNKGIIKRFKTKCEFSFYLPENGNNNYPHTLNNFFNNRNTAADFEIAVKMNHVSVSYHNRIVLQNINWQVNRGERWLIKGQNGAGKSTLLSLITGDHPQAYANKIILFDKKRGTGESIWDIKKKIGYVSPELQWYFDTDITCYQAIGSGFFDTIGLYKKLSAAQHDTVNKWLSFLRLSQLANKILSSVSTAHQRLIMLARALVKNPPLLILDEPCQGLDNQQKDAFIQLIDDICSNSDTTMIYVSHYDNEIPLCINNIFHLKSEDHNIKPTCNSHAAVAV